MKAQHKKHKSGREYIGIKATCTLYNIQGEANPEKEYYLHFNPDGTIDFTPYSSGFIVDEILDDIVWLKREWLLCYSEVCYQKAFIPRGAYDAVIQAGWKSE